MRHTTKRAILFGLGTVVASVSLFMGVSGFLFLPTSSPGFSFSLLFFGLGVSFLVAKLWSISSGLSFRLAAVQVSAAVFVGTVLTSIAVMRANWLEIMKELLQGIQH